MRCLIIGTVLCAAVATTAACSGGTSDGTARPSPSVISSAAGPSRDPQADAICADLHQNILDVDAKAFGTALGKMIAARGAGDKAEETRDQHAAVAKLNEIAGKLRTHAGEATDPRLRDALTASASNLDALAADTDGLSKVTSLDQVGDTTKRFASALSEIADYCSA
jgi:hypothetical protein